MGVIGIKKIVESINLQRMKAAFGEKKKHPHTTAKVNYEEKDEYAK